MGSEGDAPASLLHRLPRALFEPLQQFTDDLFNFGPLWRARHFETPPLIFY